MAPEVEDMGWIWPGYLASGEHTIIIAKDEPRRVYAARTMEALRAGLAPPLASGMRWRLIAAQAEIKHIVSLAPEVGYEPPDEDDGAPLPDGAESDPDGADGEWAESSMDYMRER
jgi:hypothetical protein